MQAAAPRMRADLEVLHGMDDIPMIFDPVTGSYHRITASGKVVLAHLDGTRTHDEIVQLLGADDAARRRRLEEFLQGLHASGLLVGSPAPHPDARARRVASSRLMPRVVVSRRLPAVLEPLARLLRSGPLTLLVLVAAAGAVAGYVLGATTLLRGDAPSFTHLGRAFVLATVVQLLLVLVHECAHALVAQVLRVPVRGLGVALLFYVMPVAYVDRTDAYRLRERRHRVALALAGLVSDGWACGATALVVLGTDGGLVRQTAVVLLGFQLLALAVNLNPLLPSDGYSALEAGTGQVDVRGRAFALLSCHVRRRPLPAHLAGLSARARAGHLAYGVVAALYVVVVVVVVVTGVVRTFEAALAQAAA